MAICTERTRPPACSESLLLSKHQSFLFAVAVASAGLVYFCVKNTIGTVVSAGIG